MLSPVSTAPRDADFGQPWRRLPDASRGTTGRRARAIPLLRGFPSEGGGGGAARARARGGELGGAAALAGGAAALPSGQRGGSGGRRSAVRGGRRSAVRGGGAAGLRGGRRGRSSRQRVARRLFEAAGGGAARARRVEASYQIPPLVTKNTAVVVSPLLSLMQDQVMSLKQHGVKSEFLGSTQMDSSVSNDAEKGLFDVLYMTPEKAVSLPSRFWSNLQAAGICMLAVDEAHCISEWGHDFREMEKRKQSKLMFFIRKAFFRILVQGFSTFKTCISANGSG